MLLLWVDLIVYRLLSALQFQYSEEAYTEGFSCGPPSGCIMYNFQSLHTVCTMHSLERHVIRCERLLLR